MTERGGGLRRGGRRMDLVVPRKRKREEKNQTQDLASSEQGSQRMAMQQKWVSILTALPLTSAVVGKCPSKTHVFKFNPQCNRTKG
jgi:hypothetical protein